MSNTQNHFNIRYAGLPEGEHDFVFHVQPRFFYEYYPQTEVLDSNITVNIHGVRTHDSLVLEMVLTGEVYVECDRCLDPCMVNVSVINSLVFSSDVENQNLATDDDTLFYLAPETPYIQLDEYIYDFVLLSLPIRRVHDDIEGKESACNHDMIDRIKQLQTPNLPDTRWEQLKKLLHNKN